MPASTAPGAPPSGSSPAGTSFRAAFGLLALGLAIGLAAAEVAVRILDVPPSPLAPLHVPSYQRLDNPILRYGYRPNLAADHAGYDAMHRGLATNSRGYRDAEFRIPKPAGLYRVVAVGDSTTLGLGVPEGFNTYPKVLERTLRTRTGRRLEVLNLGVGGYDPEQAAEVLRTEGPALEPDLVLLLVSLNDLDRRADGGVQAALDAAHAHLDVGAAGGLASVLARSRLWFVVRHRLAAAPSAQTAGAEAATPLEVGLERLAAYAETHDVPVWAFLLPGLDGPFARYAHGEVHARMGAIAGEVPGVRWIDLLPAFEAKFANGRVLSFDGLHPNRVGVQQLVTLMSDPLLASGLP